MLKYNSSLLDIRLNPNIYFILYMAFSFFVFRYELKQKIFLSLKTFWNYIPNRWYFFSLIALQSLMWFFAYRIFTLTGSELFVSHYNVNFGIDAVGEAKRVFSIPFFTLIISIFNLIILLSFRKKDNFHFLTHATGLSSILLNFFAGLALMSLYLINFIA